MDKIFHSGVELDIGVLQSAIKAFSLSNPALDLEIIAELVSEVQLRRNEEAETWVFSKVLAELVRNVTSSLRLMLDRFPSQLDERIVHKVR